MVPEFHKRGDLFARLTSPRGDPPPDYDMDLFRLECLHGIPDEYRQLSWKILLGLVPYYNRKDSNWQRTIVDKRNSYYRLIRDILPVKVGVVGGSEGTAAGFDAKGSNLGSSTSASGLPPKLPPMNAKKKSTSSLEKEPPLSKEVSNKSIDLNEGTKSTGTDTPLNQRRRSTRGPGMLSEPDEQLLTQIHKDIRRTFRGLKAFMYENVPQDSYTPLNGVQRTKTVKKDGKQPEEFYIDPFDSTLCFYGLSISDDRAEGKAVFTMDDESTKSIHSRQTSSVLEGNNSKNTPLNPIPNWQAMERILFIYAKLNPGVGGGYVQGMNEILAPIFYIFSKDNDAKESCHAEADAFYCFSQLISELRDHYINSMDNVRPTGTRSRAESNSSLNSDGSETFRAFRNDISAGTSNNSSNKEFSSADLLAAAVSAAEGKDTTPTGDNMVNGVFASSGEQVGETIMTDRRGSTNALSNVYSYLFNQKKGADGSAAAGGDNPKGINQPVKMPSEADFAVIKHGNGIGITMDRLLRRLRRFDRELFLDLQVKGIHPAYYSFRWLTCLLTYEFPLDDLIRIWDSIISDISFDLHPDNPHSDLAYSPGGGPVGGNVNLKTRPNKLMGSLDSIKEASSPIGKTPTSPFTKKDDESKKLTLSKKEEDVNDSVYPSNSMAPSTTEIAAIKNKTVARNNKFNFLLDICCAMLVVAREKLMASNFEECLSFLQNYTVDDSMIILDKAFEFWIPPVSQQKLEQFDALEDSLIVDKENDINYNSYVHVAPYYRNAIFKGIFDDEENAAEEPAVNPNGNGGFLAYLHKFGSIGGDKADSFFEELSKKGSSTSNADEEFGLDSPDNRSSKKLPNGQKQGRHKMVRAKRLLSAARRIQLSNKIRQLGKNHTVITGSALSSQRSSQASRPSHSAFSIANRDISQGNTPRASVGGMGQSGKELDSQLNSLDRLGSTNRLSMASSLNSRDSITGGNSAQNTSDILNEGWIYVYGCKVREYPKGTQFVQIFRRTDLNLGGFNFNAHIQSLVNQAGANNSSSAGGLLSGRPNSALSPILGSPTSPLSATSNGSGASSSFLTAMSGGTSGNTTLDIFPELHLNTPDGGKANVISTITGLTVIEPDDGCIGSPVTPKSAASAPFSDSSSASLFVSSAKEQGPVSPNLMVYNQSLGKSGSNLNLTTDGGRKRKVVNNKSNLSLNMSHGDVHDEIDVANMPESPIDKAELSTEIHSADVLDTDYAENDDNYEDDEKNNSGNDDDEHIIDTRRSRLQLLTGRRSKGLLIKKSSSAMFTGKNSDRLFDDILTETTSIRQQQRIRRTQLLMLKSNEMRERRKSSLSIETKSPSSPWYKASPLSPGSNLDTTVRRDIADGATPISSGPTDTPPSAQLASTDTPESPSTKSATTSEGFGAVFRSYFSK